MTNVHVVQVLTTGYIGAPGYTNFHFQENALSPHEPDDFNNTKTFMQAFVGMFPGAWGYEVLPEGKVFDEVTGELLSFTSSPPGSRGRVAGVSTGGFGAGVAGLCISWGTNTVNRGHKVRGRTFMIPLAASQYDGDGTPNDSTRAAAVSAANILAVAAVDFVIWSRPRAGLGGKLAPVMTARVKDQAAILRSRRT